MNAHYGTRPWSSLRAYRQIMLETERSIHFIIRASENQQNKTQYLRGISVSFVVFNLAWFTFWLFYYMCYLFGNKHVPVLEAEG